MKVHMYYLQREELVDGEIFKDQIYAYADSKEVANAFEYERDMKKFAKKVVKFDDEFEQEIFINRNGSKRLKFIMINTITDKYTNKSRPVRICIVANEMETLCLDCDIITDDKYFTDVPPDIFKKKIKKALDKLQYSSYHIFNYDENADSDAPNTIIDELNLYIRNLSDLYKI